MKIVLCSFLAAAIILGQAVSADAAGRRHRPGPAVSPPPPTHIGPIRVGNPRIFWSGAVAGAASTGAYFALRDEHALKVAGDSKNFSTGAFLLTTVGCMALAPMIAAAVVWNTEGRPLTSREAMTLNAGCIIPIIGPLLMNAAFDSNPEWERPR